MVAGAVGLLAVAGQEEGGREQGAEGPGHEAVETVNGSTWRRSPCVKPNGY